MYACNGILFNHESPLRGETFVTRKITRALARIKLGPAGLPVSRQPRRQRDWGHARDYVEMQWLMLQQDKPEDFVIATGEQYSVRDFVDAAATELGITHRWRGRGEKRRRSSKGRAATGGRRRGRRSSRVDPRYFRPTEVDTLLGDARKARRKLGWKPRRRSSRWSPKWCAKTSKPPSATSWSSGTVTPRTTITNNRTP